MVTHFGNRNEVNSEKWVRGLFPKRALGTRMKSEVITKVSPQAVILNFVKNLFSRGERYFDPATAGYDNIEVKI